MDQKSNIQLDNLIEKVKELLVIQDNYKILDSNHLEILIDKDLLAKTAELLVNSSDLNASLITLTAVDSRKTERAYTLYTVFSINKLNCLLSLKTLIEEKNPSYPAISKVIPSLNWHEREIHDLFGIIPEGIELPPLVLHRDWHPGKNFPMRKDFPKDSQIPITEHELEFQGPHGEGFHQIAVGPIHAGIIEPGHLRFCALGEEIHKFDAQLFYTHKGIEKMAEGKTPEECLEISEHICGMCSFSHSVAYCLALETLANTAIPERAVFIRMVFLELERLASHLADLMAISSSGGFAFASAYSATLREVIMRINHELTGSRFLRGLNIIGGLQKDIPDKSFNNLTVKLEKFNTDFKDLEKLILNSDSLLDRLELTGLLPKEKAKSLGLVGPPARASEIDTDIRRDNSYLAYKRYKLNVPIYDTYDALARTQVRIDEVYESVKLIKNIIEDLPSGKISVEINSYLKLTPSVGFIESPKGELVHWVMLNNDGKILRFHVRSASYMNWMGVVQATMGNNIVPDGPLVNKSFNLCYACVDR